MPPRLVIAGNALCDDLMISVSSRPARSAVRDDWRVWIRREWPVFDGRNLPQVKNYF